MWMWNTGIFMNAIEGGGMNLVIHNLRGITILVLIGLLGGCAFGTRQPTLIYPPAPQSGATPVANAAPKSAPKDVQILLDPFVDERSDKKGVGTVRNGFGMRTADVIPTNSVADWVTQALKTELQNEGYTVDVASAGNSSSRGANRVVSGEIQKVFCDMYFSYTGEVSLLVKVSRDGKDVLNKNYSGEGSAGVAWGATAESYAQSLALALAAALKPFLADLDKTLSSP
jgi:hypothetical protein